MKVCKDRSLKDLGSIQGLSVQASECMRCRAGVLGLGLAQAQS